MIITDAALSGTKRTAESNFLVANVRVARTGVQAYKRSEVGLIGEGTINVYRPEESVFAADSMSTFARRPITMGHPDAMVDSENARDLAVGWTDSTVVRDGEFVKVPIMLTDEATIKSVESGDARELSMGYRLEIELKDGVAPDGTPYEAIQKNMRMNHLAIVPRARGGSDLKIGDGDKHMADNATKVRTVLVDGLPVETTDAGAAAIEKLQKDNEALKAQVSDGADRAKKDLAEKDKDLAAKDAEIDKLKKSVLSDADIESRANARAKLIAGARKVDPNIVTDGKSNMEIKKSVLRSKLGDEAIADKSDEYIDARFDGLMDATPTDPLKSPIKSQAQDHGDDAWGASVFDAAGVSIKKEA